MNYSTFPRGEWKISAAFMEKIRDCFAAAAGGVAHNNATYCVLLDMLNQYLRYHHIPLNFTDNVLAIAVFASQIQWIDEAIRRSQRVRRSATARRRARAAAAAALNEGVNAGEAKVPAPVPEPEEEEENVNKSRYPDGYVFWVRYVGPEDFDEDPGPLPDATPFLSGWKPPDEVEPSDTG